jgi:hypothetical protein
MSCTDLLTLNGVSCFGIFGSQHQMRTIKTMARRLQEYLLAATISGGFITAAVTESFVTASSEHPGDYRGFYAFDGDRGTRWASHGGRPGEYLQIDLGREVVVGPFRIFWEAAYARDYSVYGSVDGTDWNLRYQRTDGRGGEEVVPDTGGTARHLRIVCHTPGPFGLYSIWEVSFDEMGAAEALRAQTERQVQAIEQAQVRQRAVMRDRLERAGVREIVFATRAMGPDSHWYANVG